MKRSSKNMLAMSLCCLVIAITTGANFIANLQAKCDSVSNSATVSDIPNNIFI